VEFVEQLRGLTFGPRDVLEIAIVAYVLYRVLLLIHGTRAVQMLTGIVVLVVVYLIAWVFKLKMITYLLGLMATYGAFAAVVIFQPEIRQALAHLGQSRVTRLLRRMGESEVADEVADALERLTRSGIGAIIAVEREIPLGDYIESGSALSAKVSADLLATIFTPYSPLHDGAVIIRGDTIIAAGCILPLSQATISDRSLGTRHRAALGLSEETDAVIMAVDGHLDRSVTPSQVRDLLGGRPLRTTAEHAATLAQGHGP
jgi:diadenylate cyclase